MRQLHGRGLGAIALSLALAGCASLGQAGGGSSLDVISLEEIQESRESNLYDLVQRERPRWLRSRGERSLLGVGTAILVYRNETRLGGLDELRHLPLLNISEIRALDSAEAGRLPGIGSGHVERVIQIVMNRQ